MKSRLLALGSLFLVATLASPSFGQVSIGDFPGGVPEAGWGHFSGGVQPLDASVYGVSDLDTSGDGGALETNIAGFNDSIGYSFTTAGTVSDFFDNHLLVFDLIYRGTATDPGPGLGGYDQVYQVLFQSDYNGFALTAITQTADAVALTSFGAGGTSAGFGDGNQPPAYRLGVAIDYTPFLNTLPNNFVPSTLQFWITTNDDNRIYKAIDNVRLDGAVPEPASLVLFGLGSLAMLSVARRRS